MDGSQKKVTSVGLLVKPSHQLIDETTKMEEMMDLDASTKTF